MSILVVIFLIGMREKKIKKVRGKRATIKDLVFDDAAENAEKTLWLNVLMKAVSDLIDPKSIEGRYDVYKSRRKGEMQEEMREYFFMSKCKKIGSFLWLCDLFDLEPERIRRVLKKASHKDV